MILSPNHWEILGTKEKSELSCKGNMNTDQKNIMSKHSEKVSRSSSARNLKVLFDISDPRLKIFINLASSDVSL